MKRMLLLIVLLLSVSSAAKSEKVYVQGTLTDITDSSQQRIVPNSYNHTSISVIDVEYRLAVKIGDITYVGSYWPRWRWSYAPTDLMINAPIKARLEGKKMILLLPSGKELETKIIRRIADYSKAQTPSAK